MSNGDHPDWQPDRSSSYERQYVWFRNLVLFLLLANLLWLILGAME